jgi:shikimate dehydrogenase
MISGHTRIIAHLGVPTEPFRSPMIYNPWFAKRGIDAAVVPMGCEAADFAAFLPLVFRLRNIVGALITMPHKVAAAGLLDQASKTVRICGSCNAIRRDDEGRLIGDMFDGEGFVSGILRRGRSINGRSALVVGAGGAGSAIAAALAREGVARLALFDVHTKSADTLAERLKTYYPALTVETGTNDPSGFDIVLNATPLGMKDDDPLPIDPDRIDPSTLVGDVVMREEDTTLLAAARRRGCAVQVGTDMLFEQIPAYLAFFGFPPATPDELRRCSQAVKA